MAYGEEIEYCEKCGTILESHYACQNCGELTEEGKNQQEQESNENEE